MTNRKKTNSVFFRTIILLTFSTIFVFSVLCVVYYQRMSSSILAEESRLLYKSVQSAAAGYDSIKNKNDEDTLPAASEQQYIDSVALSVNGYVWVVEKDGKISCYSDIPTAAITQLRRQETSFFMTQTH